MLEDTFHRQITYLRISVTDRCNLRCIYCMPPEGIPWQPHEDILTYEEIAKVVRAAATLGVKSIRLTGGDPLVRHDISSLVKLIAAVPQIEDISLTTNGILLESQARDLAAAGLKRVNISLDTLDTEKYAQITRGGSLKKVWDGIDAAEREGLSPVKINTVILGGVNDDELIDLAMLSRQHPWHIRFIEYMPIFKEMSCEDWVGQPQNAYFPVKEMMVRLALLGLEPAYDLAGSGPARVFKIKDSIGTVGFISPIGEHFCQHCNRLRLTADGSLRPCLLSDIEIPLRQVLRTGGDIQPLIQQAVLRKPISHQLDESPGFYSRSMREIGG